MFVNIMVLKFCTIKVMQNKLCDLEKKKSLTNFFFNYLFQSSRVKQNLTLNIASTQVMTTWTISHMQSFSKQIALMCSNRDLIKYVNTF